MRRCLAVLVPAIILLPAACGTGTDQDPYAAAAQRFQECQADPTGFALAPDGDPDGLCVAECLAGAPCEELTGCAKDAEDCIPVCALGGSTFDCAFACLGGDPSDESAVADECSTPLVLSFDGAPVVFSRGHGAFDLGVGMSVATDWPTAATPWLALDRNGNGTIDDAGELFGSATPLRGGGRAKNGFEALRELDSDGDGRITPKDEAWPRLLVWTDRDGDRASSPDELVPLAQTGVVAIDLAYAREPRCDSRGNCEGERTGFAYRDADGLERRGAVIDVYLRFQRD